MRSIHFAQIPNMRGKRSMPFSDVEVQDLRPKMVETYVKKDLREDMVAIPLSREALKEVAGKRYHQQIKAINEATDEEIERACNRPSDKELAIASEARAKALDEAALVCGAYIQDMNILMHFKRVSTVTTKASADAAQFLKAAILALKDKQG